ncbi:DUF3558 family protein [Gordonia effusa]|nr:DUF3558 family protein [Gordonia effusa]
MATTSCSPSENVMPSSENSQASASLMSRVNPGNDGTTYEPCDALSSEVASSLKVNIGSQEDAAAATGQTARGCRWKLTDNRRWIISQIVGNSTSLSDYKASQADLKWRTDIIANGRTVAISEVNAATCSAHVQSQRSTVSTIAQFGSPQAPPIDEICNRAIAFTKATIDKMPP